MYQDTLPAIPYQCVFIVDGDKHVLFVCLYASESDAHARFLYFFF